MACDSCRNRDPPHPRCAHICCVNCWPPNCCGRSPACNLCGAVHPTRPCTDCGMPVCSQCWLSPQLCFACHSAEPGIPDFLARALHLLLRTRSERARAQRNPSYRPFRYHLAVTTGESRPAGALSEVASTDPCHYTPVAASCSQEVATRAPDQALVHERGNTPAGTSAGQSCPPSGEQPGPPVPEEAWTGTEGLIHLLAGSGAAPAQPQPDWLCLPTALPGGVAATQLPTVCCRYHCQHAVLPGVRAAHLPTMLL